MCNSLSENGDIIFSTKEIKVFRLFKNCNCLFLPQDDIVGAINFLSLIARNGLLKL
ncbi:hypothetical protein KSU1_D0203 [Candidatus Jettenia caeni]|uniref:Uncharacterized protein n=1 Tax=Candidatus Jettenia caeni TaxID=247490 RepID=I3IP67_9BACT|nr:hypothetical protein KSU1_D0203 [Candidatus Jettenia caeni]